MIYFRNKKLNDLFFPKYAYIFPNIGIQISPRLILNDDKLMSIRIVLTKSSLKLWKHKKQSPHFVMYFM